jgi:hypothetical protein
MRPIVVALLLALCPEVRAAEGEKKSEPKIEETQTAGMSPLSFCAKVIEHTAWPLVVLAVVFMFRARLEKLIDRLQKFKGPGGIEGEFREGIKELQELGDKANLPESSDKKVIEVSANNVITISQDASAEESIKVAIDKTWRRVQDLVQNDYKAMKKMPNGTFVVGLPATLMLFFEKLRELHVKAVRSESLTQSDAADYFNEANRFIATLEQHRKDGLLRHVDTMPDKVKHGGE